MAKTALTYRQIDNLRSESMRWASFMLKRLRMSVLGEPVTESCECGKEYELFPNQPIKLDNAQIAAVKYDVDKVYPGLADDEISRATGETDPKKNYDELARYIRDSELARTELDKRGVRITLDKPMLEAV